MSAFVEWLDRWRRAILLVTALLLVVCGASITRLEIEMDLLAQLPSGSSVFRDYRDVLHRFGTTDTLVLLVAGPPDALPAFGEDLARRLTVLPGIISVRTGIDPESLRRHWLVPHRWQLLDDAGYDEIEKLFAPEAIRERVAASGEPSRFPASRESGQQ